MYLIPAFDVRYQLMLQCWEYWSRRRPAFADMVSTIDGINGNISSEVSGCDSELGMFSRVNRSKFLYRRELSAELYAVDWSFLLEFCIQFCDCDNNLT